MKVLVFFEYQGRDLLRGFFGVLVKVVLVIGGWVGVVLVGGFEVKELVVIVGCFGVIDVYIVQDAFFDLFFLQSRVDVLEVIVWWDGYDIFLFFNLVFGVDVVVGFVVCFDVGFNWDFVDIEVNGDEFLGKCLVFQDVVLIDVGWCGEYRVVLFWFGFFDFDVIGGVGDIEGRVIVEFEVYEILVEFQFYLVAVRVMGWWVQEGEVGFFVEGVDVIVVGGMGFGVVESFALVEELVGVFGGVVGVIWVVVYVGWYFCMVQIGQIGKIVVLRLYVVLGIFGVVQYKVGMQSFKVIVVINKDLVVLIFEFSDLVVVGDVQVIVL